MAKRIFKKYYIKAIRRLRHRRGFGVHSPFAFNLITKVIEENFMYYSYAEIEQIRREKLQGKLNRKSLNRRAEISFKKGSLLFRLVNRFTPSFILEICTAWGISTLYLHNGHSTSHLVCIEPDNAVAEMAKKVVGDNKESISFLTDSLSHSLDLYFISGTELNFVYVHQLSNPADYTWLIPLLIEHSGDKTVWVINGIRSHERIAAAWRLLIADNKVRVTMDLYDMGLAFNNPKLNKQDYVVAF